MSHHNQSDVVLIFWREIILKSLINNTSSLTVYQFGIFLYYYHSNEEFKSISLAKKIGLKLPAFNRAIDALTTHNLVARRFDPQEPRSFFMERTAAGHALMNEIIATSSSKMIQWPERAFTAPSLTLALALHGAMFYAI